MTKIADEYPSFALETADKWQAEQCFMDGSHGWYVSELWKAAEGLPTYEVPLIAMDTGIRLWAGVGDDFMIFLAHAKLIQKANLKYPIIMTPDGTIADGRHRLAKAIIEGKTTIKMKRLIAMPEPDFEYDPDKED